MKINKITALFCFLIASFTYTYAQDNYNRNTFATDSVRIANEIKQLKAKEAQKNLELQKIKEGLTKKNDSMKKLVDGKSKHINDVKNASYEKQVRQDLKNLSPKDFTEKYAIHRGMYSTISKELEPILLSIVEEELSRAGGYEKYFKLYKNNILMEQSIIIYYLNEMKVKDSYGDGILSGDNLDTFYYKYATASRKDLIVFYNELAFFAKDRLDKLNQYYFLNISREGKGLYDLQGNTYASLHFTHNLLKIVDEEPASSKIKQSREYIQDALIKHIILNISYIPEIRGAYIEILNFDNLGLQHMQKEVLVKAFDMKNPEINKSVYADSYLRKALIKKGIIGKEHTKWTDIF